MCTGAEGFLLAQGASVGLSAFGSARDAEAKKASLKYEAAIAKQNKKIADLQAVDVIERGKEEADRNKLGITNLKSSIKAQLGASGLRSDDSDAVDLLVSADVIGLKEHGIIMDNAEKEAWERRVQANNFEADSSVLAARAERENPLKAGFSTLLSGGLSVASKWYANKPRGTTTTTTTVS